MSGEIICEAIHPNRPYRPYRPYRPFRDDVLLATKAGLTRNGPDPTCSGATGNRCSWARRRDRRPGARSICGSRP
ncbi:hypothetical protein ACGFW5_33130 [Streptomyces sp. NPDC048416]|uniref:hypothetical protein n=1 Tax=Streptomyces sp. NPDC048416 TaxID=3365546 RepID=UPI00370F8E59